MADTLLLEQRAELSVAFEEEVLLAAGNPKQLQVAVHGIALVQGGRDRIRRRRRGTERSDPTELVVMIQRHGESVMAAHRQSGKGARLRAGGNAVGMLN